VMRRFPGNLTKLGSDGWIDIKAVRHELDSVRLVQNSFQGKMIGIPHKIKNGP